MVITSILPTGRSRLAFGDRDHGNFCPVDRTADIIQLKPGNASQLLATGAVYLPGEYAQTAVAANRVRQPRTAGQFSRLDHHRPVVTAKSGITRSARPLVDVPVIPNIAENISF